MEPLHSADPPHIGGYRLISRLGAGGMGRVYLARTPSGRRLVVKIVRPELVLEEGFRARFAREAEAARRVGGFHTAQVVDADPGADPPWIATAHIDGLTLHAAVRDHGPIFPPALHVLASGLAEGLDAIHRCDLVHRDLKPANIILADDGPRIIDFGIARPLDSESMTTHGAVFGTLPYMSPEQTDGSRVGAASDVFSLGTVLSYAATGTNPFTADSMAATVHRLIGPTPDPGDIDPTVRNLIADCWGRDPGQRPTPAQILARFGEHDLHDSWPPSPVTGTGAGTRRIPSPPSPVAEAPRETRTVFGSGPPLGGIEAAPTAVVNEAPDTVREATETPASTLRAGEDPKDARRGTRPWVPWVALMAVGALVIGTLIVVNGSSGADITLSGHQDNVETVAFSPDGALLATGADDRLRLWNARTGDHVRTLDDPWVQSAAFGPDGDLLASGCQRDVCLWDVESGELSAALTGHEGAVHGLAFNGDGTMLATASQDTTVRLWDIAAGEHLTTLSGHRSNVRAVAFSPDGETLVTGGHITVRLWDVETGKGIAELTEHGNSTVHTVAFSPDGTTFASGDASGNVLIWDAETNERRAMRDEHGSTVNAMAYSPDGSVLATAGNDSAVRLWDPATGAPLGAFEGHRSPVHAVAFSSDGTTLASGDQDGTAHLWDVDRVLTE